MTDTPYVVRVELKHGDFFKSGTVVVSEESFEAFKTFGQDALEEASANIVTRLRIAMEEENGNDE